MKRLYAYCVIAISVCSSSLYSASAAAHQRRDSQIFKITANPQLGTQLNGATDKANEASVALNKAADAINGLQKELEPIFERCLKKVTFATIGMMFVAAALTIIVLRSQNPAISNLPIAAVQSAQNVSDIFKNIFMTKSSGCFLGGALALWLALSQFHAPAVPSTTRTV